MLDLDDTLLNNNIKAFLPYYLDAFSRFVADQIDPTLFIKSLIAGTQVMTQNRLPDCTLKEVFDSVFFPLVGVRPDEFQVTADRFYHEVFPTLQRYTSPIPEAVELVEEAARRGYRLAITTNPMFPIQAVLQRLAWANLPTERYPFELVASYERFHFAKPDPAFFAEVLGRLGWPEGAVVVVGDDLKRDMFPAQTLGIPGYWISPQADYLGTGEALYAATGSQDQVLPWIDQHDLETLVPDFSTPQASLAILRATPAVFDSFSRELPEMLWSERPADGEWSMTEVFCHLRDVEQEVNQPRLDSVIEFSNPFIAGQDTDPWAETRHYRDQDGRQALSEFIVARQKVITLLESLDSGDWQRPARHAIFGPTRLQELVEIIASHDRLHQQQVSRLVRRFISKP
jgi:HAD superfamily hydrolase (TIGR01549 family)